MRVVERIPLVLKYINWKTFLEDIFIDVPKSGFEYKSSLTGDEALSLSEAFGFDSIHITKNKYLIDIDASISIIVDNYYEIISFWKENPDLRLIQLLVNLNVIPNAPGRWYYIEEDEYLIEKGLCKPEEILFWGSFGKNWDESLKWILINDMETDHLLACLKTQKNISKLREEAMRNVLKNRNVI